MCALSNEPCMTRPTIIDWNPFKLNYYSFMVSLEKCNGSFNVVDDLSAKLCVLIETKDIIVKKYFMWLQIQIQHINQIKKGILINVNVIGKSLVGAKKL